MSDPQQSSLDEEEEESFFMRVGLIILCVVLILLVAVAIAIFICLYRRYKYRPRLAAIFTRPVKKVLSSRSGMTGRNTTSRKATFLSRDRTCNNKTDKWLETNVPPIHVPVHTPHSLTFGAVVDDKSQPSQQLVQRQQEDVMVQSRQQQQLDGDGDLTVVQNKMEAVVVEPTHLFQYYVQTREGKAQLLSRENFLRGHHVGLKRDILTMPIWRSLMSRRSKKRLSGSRSDLLIRRHAGQTARSNLSMRKANSYMSDPGVLRETSHQAGGARLNHLEIRPEHRHTTIANGVANAPLRSNLANNSMYAYALQGGGYSTGYSTGYSIDRSNDFGNMQATILPSRVSQWGMSRAMGQSDFTISGRNVTVS